LLARNLMDLNAIPTQLRCGRLDLIEAKLNRMILMMKIIIRSDRFRREKWSDFRPRVVRVILPNPQILSICLVVWYILICRKLKSLEMIEARNVNNRLKKIIECKPWREKVIVTSSAITQSIDKDNDLFQYTNLLIE